MLKRFALVITFVCFTMALLGARHRIGHAQDLAAPPLPLYKTDWRASLDANRFAANAPAADAGERATETAAASANQFDNWWRYVYQYSEELIYDDPVVDIAIQGPDVDGRLAEHPAADYQPRLNFDATQVVFVSERDGNPELYKVNPDDSGLTRLTSRDGFDIMPAWSPDGRQIAFVSNRSGSAQIYVMGADGENVRALTNEHDNIWIDWSTANDKLTWIQIRGEERFLMVANADGSAAQTLAGPLPFAQHPRWSPDGGRIALDYDKNGDFANDIILVNAETAAARTLVTGEVDRPTFRDLGLDGWTPDGQRLIYQEYNYGLSNGRLELYRVDTQQTSVADGGDNYFGSLPRRALQIDVRDADPYAPQSTLDALPAFVREGFLSLLWRGADRGPSGIDFYSIEARAANEDQWQHVVWSYNLPGANIPPAHRDGTRQILVDGVLGKRSQFRTRSQDHAGNEEAWPARFDAATTVYRWEINGAYTDNRGQPLASRPLESEASLAPNPRTGRGGRYTLYVGDVQRASVESTTIDISGDSSLNLLAVPADAVTLLSEATTLQTPCSGLCPNQPRLPVCDEAADSNCPVPEPIGPGAITLAAAPQLVADTNNVLHLLYAIDGGVVIYQKRPPDGAWSEPEAVARGGFAERLALKVGQDGIVHAAWDARVDFDSTVFYSQRTPADGWLTRQLGSGESPKLQMDAQNQLHLLYQCTHFNCTGGEGFGLLYTRRNRDGSWSTPTQWAEEVDVSDSHALATTPDGAVHAAWEQARDPNATADFSGGVFYRRSVDGRRWGQVEEVALVADSTSRMRMIGTADNTVHLVWSGFEQFTKIYHHQRNAATRKQTTAVYGPPNLRYSSLDYALYTTSSGDLYLLLEVEDPLADNQTRLIQYTEPVGASGLTFVDAGLAQSIGRINASQIDSSGQLHLIASTPIPDSDASTVVYYRSESAAASQSITESATFDVPATLHEPTLSFLHTLRGASGNPTSVDITIDDGVASTQVFTATDDSSGAVGWADLSPWSGQTVTATFALNQAEGAPSASVTLEQVTLGSWRTAVVASVEPLVVDVGGATLTLRGENFLEGLQASVRHSATGAESPLSARLVDGTMLEVDVPAGLAPGLYQVSVTNSGGEAFVAAEPLQIGECVLLPIIGR